MIQLSKSGNSVTFTFDENSGYLQNGTIDVPINSLALIIDESDMATFRKSASNDIFISARYADFGMTKAELEAWYKANMVSSGGGGGGGVTPEEVQGMIDESISGLAESSAVTLEISEATSGKVDADSLATVATSGSYNDLLDKPTIPTVPTDVSAFNNDAGYATSGYVDSEVSGKVDTSSVVTAVTSASTDSEIPTAKAVYDAIPSGGGATYIAGDGISIDTANTITAVFDGVYGYTNVYNELTDVNEAIYVIVPYDCEGQTDGGFSLVVDGNDFIVHVDSSSGDYSVDESEVNWTEYFSITWDSTKKLFLIDPFEGSFESLNNDEGCVRFAYPDDVELKYSGTTSNAIKEAFKGLENLNIKVNNRVDFVEFELVSGDVYTISGDVASISGNVNTISGDVANKQDTLVSGTNIKTINNESILGSGNITIQGGGKAIEAGRGISITTGETADTVSFNLPISAGTGTSSIVGGKGNSTGGNYSFVFGDSNICGVTTLGASIFGEHNSIGYGARCSNIEGGYNTIGINVNYAHSEGCYTSANATNSHSEGCYTSANATNSHTEGFHTQTNNNSEHASGIYNVSNTGSTDADKTLFSVGNGTADNARHNAFEIRQNGDIYLSLNGQDVKLQDQLGGGGGTTYSAGTDIDITNDVISVKQISGDSAFVDVTSTLENETSVTINTSAIIATMKEGAVSNGVSFYDNNGRFLTVENNGSGLDVLGNTPYFNYSTDGYTITASTLASGDTFISISNDSGNQLDSLVEYFAILTTTYSLQDFADNVYGKFSGYVATSAVTSSVTSSSTDVITSGGVYAQLGGLKLQQITQSAYDALSPNYDSNTLYVIVN